MNSPMPPVRTQSLPKNGNALRNRSVRPGSAGSVSMCRKLMRRRTRPFPSAYVSRKGRCIV